MKIKKEKIIFLIIICLLIQIVNPALVKTAEKNGSKLVVTGSIEIEIKDFTTGNTRTKKQNLENYPARICYMDNNGTTKKEGIITNNSGRYKVTLKSQSGIKKVWLEVEADNVACMVYPLFRSNKDLKKYILKNNGVEGNLTK